MNSQNLKIGCIIYSRMQSKRFPNKAIFEVSGIPLLQRVINKTKLINKKSVIIVATSLESSDEGICKIAEKNDLAFHRGSHENVYHRTVETINRFNLDYFIRICGDRPLLDPFLHDLAITQSIEEKLDLCTTLNPNILPPGLTVEVISSKSFLSGDYTQLSKFDKEHITSKYYKNPSLFKVKKLKLPKEINWTNKKFLSYTLDESKDIKFLEYNIKNLNKINSGIDYHLKLQNLALNWGKN